MLTLSQLDDYLDFAMYAENLLCYKDTNPEDELPSDEELDIILDNTPKLEKYVSDWIEYRAELLSEFKKKFNNTVSEKVDLIYKLTRDGTSKSDFFWNKEMEELDRNLAILDFLINHLPMEYYNVSEFHAMCFEFFFDFDIFDIPGPTKIYDWDSYPSAGDWPKQDVANYVTVPAYSKAYHYFEAFKKVYDEGYERECNNFSDSVFTEDP